MGKGHKEAADQVKLFSFSFFFNSIFIINQPDYEHEWLTKTLDNDARAIERGQQAIDKLHADMMQNENERNLHILHRFVKILFN